MLYPRLRVEFNKSPLIVRMLAVIDANTRMAGSEQNSRCRSGGRSCPFSNSECQPAFTVCPSSLPYDVCDHRCFNSVSTLWNLE